MRPSSLIPLLMLLCAAPLGAQTCLPDVPGVAPDTRYTVVSAPGTWMEEVVLDNDTGLMWKRCPEGLWGVACSGGFPEGHTFLQALAVAGGSIHAGFDDWRLPSIMELQSLVETACWNPAINPTMFPAVQAWYYWTSTTYAPNPLFAWTVSFGNGNAYSYHKESMLQVLLVRGGRGLDGFASRHDATPDGFDPIDQIDVPVSSVRTSAPFTVAGLSTVTGIGVSGAAGSAYSINSMLDGDFTRAPGAVKAGDVVRVRHTSAALPGASTITSLIIGGVSGDFVTTTSVPAVQVAVFADGFEQGARSMDDTP